jgi:hypothetical protein
MKQVTFKFLFLLLMPALIFAEVKSNGTISGFVYDQANGEALPGANVFIENTYLGSSTNQSGYYVIPRLPVGEYFIICDYMGYKNFRKKIQIIANANLKLNIHLQEEVLQTEAVVVSAESVRTVIRMYQRPISKVALSAQQIRQIPQIAEADLLRSLQTLPGIVPVSDFSSGLYVRGGTPDQNLYLLDGTDVYNPEHAFGLFSTFNTDAIKQVDVSKGGFGAEYGGRLSSVVDITNIDGNREEFQGSASISLLSARTTLQMPVGKKGSISGSIRRTYFDQTVSLIVENLPEYYFYDGNIKAFFEIDRNNKLALSGYWGRDFLGVIFNPKSTEKTGFDYDWGNRTGSIRWTHVFTPKLFSNFWLTGSRFSSNLDFPAYLMTTRNLITDVTLKGNLEYHYSNQIKTKFGFEHKILHGLYKEEGDEGMIHIDLRPRHSVAYLQGNWQPTPLWDIQAGLRLNHFDVDTTFFNLAPRFSMKYRLTDKINLKAATGVYYQYLHRIPQFIAAAIWSTSNKHQHEAKSSHIILGFQQEIADDYEFEIEGFYKEYTNIYEFNQNVGADIQPTRFAENETPIYGSTKGVFNRGDGHSTGFELLLRKDIGRITGWIAYTWSKTKYQFDGINQEREFAPRHDRAHTVNVVNNLNFEKFKGEWTLGTNLVYSSGQPFTEPGSGYIIGSSPVAPGRYVEYYPTRINNIRLPAYARLDLSLTYTKNFRTWSMAPYIQVYNIGNRKNVWFMNYDYSNGIPDFEERYMLPILPTLGITFKF